MSGRVTADGAPVLEIPVFFWPVGESTRRSLGGPKQLLSTDSGLPSTASFVQVDPHQPSTVYAVSAGGLFKSIDRGATWHGTAAAAVSSLWTELPAVLSFPIFRRATIAC
jgi:hypothetical protein